MALGDNRIMTGIDHKRIVISGGGSGIGAALVRTLAIEGHQVFITGRRVEKLCEVASGLPNVWYQACDVSDEGQVRNLAATISEQASRIDALVNCAAIIGPVEPTIDVELNDLRRVFEINVCGTLLIIRHFLSLLLKSSRPRIVNFAGGGAFSVFPNYSAYAISKAAVVRLTENLAVELADGGVCVNAVAPGFVATDIHEATLKAGPARAGEEYYRQTQRLLAGGSIPIEVPVACVRFLLSDQAGELTGKTISASFDPWGTPEFVELIPQINQSDLYTQRRINLANLPEEPWRVALSASSNRKDR